MALPGCREHSVLAPPTQGTHVTLHMSTASPWGPVPLWLPALSDLHCLGSHCLFSGLNTFHMEPSPSSSLAQTE